VTVGDLINSGKLLEVHCSSCRPARHLYIDAGSLDLPKRQPVPEVAKHLVCSVCGARNDEHKRRDYAARCQSFRGAASIDCGAARTGDDPCRLGFGWNYLP